MVSDFFYPNVGGVEGHIYAVGKELVARGHKVIVITHAYSSCSPSSSVSPIRSRRIGVRHLSCGLTVYYLPLATLASEATLPNFFTSHPLLRYIMIRESIDVVHGHASLSSLAHEALFHARALSATGGGGGKSIPRRGIKTVFTDHSLFSLGEDAASALTNKLLAFVLSDVDRVVTVSYTGKENTCLRAQLDPRKVSVIPNAVDSQHFYPPSDPLPNNLDGRITVVVLSRLTYRKGISLLLDVVPQVCAACPDVDFLIGGDGPKRIDLEQMREGFHRLLLDRVRLVGQVSGADAVRQHLHSGQIFLSPSLTEAFGTTLIEAASCGLLCVATRVGGVPETLPSPEALLLAEPSADDLCNVLKVAVARIREERRRRKVRKMTTEQAFDPLANRSTQLSDTFRQTYAWSDVARRLETVYHEALLEPHPTTMERMQRYYRGSLDQAPAALHRGTIAGIVFCIVVATNLAFAAVLEWIWPAEDIERSPWLDEQMGTEAAERPNGNI